MAGSAFGEVDRPARVRPLRRSTRRSFRANHFWVVVRLFFRKKSYPLFVGKVQGDWDALDDLCERLLRQSSMVSRQTLYSSKTFRNGGGRKTNDATWGTTSALTSTRLRA